MKKPTINDVAKAANVSAATVSYVLNATPGIKISEKTASRVKEAASSLNYLANISAVGLLSGQPKCIGVVLAVKLIQLRHAKTLQGVIDELSKHDISIFLCTTTLEPNGKPNYLNAYYSKRVAGLIFLSDPDGEVLSNIIEADIQKNHIPFVAYNCEYNRNFSSVDIDYFSGAYDMVLHLAGLGTKRIFYIQPYYMDRQERDREQGVWRAIYETHDVDLKIVRLESEPGSMIKSETDKNQELSSLMNETNYELMKNHLNELDGASALLCSWSSMDQAALSITRERQLNIPIAVLAQGTLSTNIFKNIIYSYLPTYQIGVKCAEVILKLLNNPLTFMHEHIKPYIKKQDCQ